MRRILIAGAGIAGLALIRALEDHECEVDVVERREAIEGDGVGIVLMPNGVSALEWLGIGAAARAAATEIRVLQLERGRDHLQVSLADVWHGCASPTIGIRRTELFRLLVPRPSSSPRPRVNLHAGRRLVGIESIDARPVARFADGTSASYDLVVGADGVRSAVRCALYPDARPTAAGLYYLRFLSRAGRNQAADVWRSVEGTDATFGFIPAGPQLVHCFVQLRTTSAPCAAGEEDHYLQTVVCGWDDTLARAYADRCGATRAGAAMVVDPIRWGRGACVLIGDASHALAPTLSEGGSLALEDAIVLASLLRQQADISDVGQRFRDLRVERVQWAHRMATAQTAAITRSRGRGFPRSELAVEYMTQLYRPLCRNVLPDSSESRAIIPTG